MKLTRTVHRAGLCLALTLSPAVLAQQQPQKQKPDAKTTTAEKKTKPAASTSSSAKPVAPTGMVIVKDWESGGALRAPVAGDFPASLTNGSRLRTGGPVVTPAAAGGGIEVVDPEGLQTTMTVRKDANGALTYSCNEPGDHSKHKHAATAATPIQTPKPAEVK